MNRWIQPDISAGLKDEDEKEKVSLNRRYLRWGIHPHPPFD